MYSSENNWFGVQEDNCMNLTAKTHTLMATEWKRSLLYSFFVCETIYGRITLFIMNH